MQGQMNVPPGMAMALNDQARLMAAKGQFTPVTSAGGPTVAAKNLAELSQLEAAKQAKIASGIEAMNQAKMQQQLQQMLAQKAAPPVPLASGIAANADVQMAEGGIVGYAGPTGSFVSNLSMEEIERMTPDMRKAYFKELLERRNAPLPTPTAPAAPPAASMRPGLGMAGAVAKKLGPLGLLAELFTTSDEDIATLQKAEAERNAAPAGARPRGQENYEPLPPVVPEDTTSFMQQYANVPGQGRRGPLAEAPSPRPPAPQRTEQRKPAAEVAKPADAGIASLMGPAVPSGSERQFAEALAAQARMQLPPERTAQQLRTEREDYYRSLGIDPDFARSRLSRIEAQEARDRAEAEERAKLVKERGMENLISRLTRAKGPTGLAALAQAQLGMEPIIAAQRASDERFNAVMRERQIAADRERTAVEDMQRALADGDIARAEKSRNEALAARNAKNEMEAKIRAQYAPQMLQAETSAADRASREREAAAGRATQLEAARIGVSKPTAQETLRDWFQSDPKGFSAFIEAQNEPKSAAAIRKSLMEQWSKNLMLQTKFPNFEDFVTTMAPPTSATGAGAGEFKVLGSRPK